MFYRLVYKAKSFFRKMFRKTGGVTTPFGITLEFSEPITGFDPSDIKINGDGVCHLPANDGKAINIIVDKE